MFRNLKRLEHQESPLSPLTWALSDILFEQGHFGEALKVEEADCRFWDEEGTSSAHPKHALKVARLCRILYKLGRQEDVQRAQLLEEQEEFCMLTPDTFLIKKVGVVGMLRQGVDINLQVSADFFFFRFSSFWGPESD